MLQRVLARELKTLHLCMHSGFSTRASLLINSSWLSNHNEELALAMHVFYVIVLGN